MAYHDLSCNNLVRAPNYFFKSVPVEHVTWPVGCETRPFLGWRVGTKRCLKAHSRDVHLTCPSNDGPFSLPLQGTALKEIKLDCFECEDIFVFVIMMQQCPLVTNWKRHAGPLREALFRLSRQKIFRLCFLTIYLNYDEKIISWHELQRRRQNQVYSVQNIKLFWSKHRTPVPTYLPTYGEERSWLARSVTRLGDFLNYLVTHFLTKVVQIFWYLFGLF